MIIASNSVYNRLKILHHYVTKKTFRTNITKDSLSPMYQICYRWSKTNFHFFLSESELLWQQTIKLKVKQSLTTYMILDVSRLYIYNYTHLQTLYIHRERWVKTKNTGVSHTLTQILELNSTQGFNGVAKEEIVMIFAKYSL